MPVALTTSPGGVEWCAEKDTTLLITTAQSEDGGNITCGKLMNTGPAANSKTLNDALPIGGQGSVSGDMNLAKTMVVGELPVTGLTAQNSTVFDSLPVVRLGVCVA